ncbi:Probable cytochrome P450 301a1, mitochondrial [Eumeta japonica]|uniref:Probable cytochrome P450 301a1, mitochondrial n=1 Tax=Eumeta variegata TaxID=151549 RepID=A0A4C1UB10_EUMVA|nr:Probable cytochrome P450 301a1, mitochondrial [Eumeta japonica]
MTWNKTTTGGQWGGSKNTSMVSTASALNLSTVFIEIMEEARRQNEPLHRLKEQVQEVLSTGGAGAPKEESEAFKYAYRNVLAFSKFYLQTTKTEEVLKQDDILKSAESYVYGVNQDKDRISNEILPSAPITPMLMSIKEPIVLSFDDVPGPKSLKYLANVRQYFSDIGAYFDTPKSFRTLSRLFDEYGPVVRFVSPVGKDIVLINHPDHIQKVYAMEGEYPVRSALDSLEKYRIERQNYIHGGLYTV